MAPTERPATALVPPSAKWLSSEPALARIGEILTHDLAQGREGAAQRWAFETDIAADQVVMGLSMPMSLLDPAPTIDVAGTIAANPKLGSAAVRTRIVEILRSPAARGRERQALYTAFKTDLTTEQSIAALEAGNRDVSAAQSSPSARVEGIDTDALYRRLNGWGPRASGLDADAIYRRQNGHAPRAKGENAADIYARRAQEARGKK